MSSSPQFAKRYEPERISNVDAVRALLLSGKARFMARRGDVEFTYRVSRVKDTAQILLVSYLNTTEGVNTFNYVGRVRIVTDGATQPILLLELTMRSMVSKYQQPFTIFADLLAAVNANYLDEFEIHAA
jgi:hypothetical protein